MRLQCGGGGGGSDTKSKATVTDQTQSHRVRGAYKSQRQRQRQGKGKATTSTRAIAVPVPWQCQGSGSGLCWAWPWAWGGVVSNNNRKPLSLTKHTVRVRGACQWQRQRQRQSQRQMQRQSIDVNTTSTSNNSKTHLLPDAFCHCLFTSIFARFATAVLGRFDICSPASLARGKIVGTAPATRCFLVRLPVILASRTPRVSMESAVKCALHNTAAVPGPSQPLLFCLTAATHFRLKLTSKGNVNTDMLSVATLLHPAATHLFTMLVYNFRIKIAFGLDAISNGLVSTLPLPLAPG